MHEVVPSAVSAAVSAAIAMRITTSQKPFFFIRFYLLILNSKGRFAQNYKKIESKNYQKIISGRRPYNFLVNFLIILRPLWADP